MDNSTIDTDINLSSFVRSFVNFVRDNCRAFVQISISSKKAVSRNWEFNIKIFRSFLIECLAGPLVGIEPKVS